MGKVAPLSREERSKGLFGASHALGIRQTIGSYALEPEEPFSKADIRVACPGLEPPSSAVESEFAKLEDVGMIRRVTAPGERPAQWRVAAGVMSAHWALVNHVEATYQAEFTAGFDEDLLAAQVILQ